MKATRSLVAAAIALACTAAAAQTISYAEIPAYGRPVELSLRDPAHPVFLPATRYKQEGNVITIDYEYRGAGFGPFAPDFGNEPVPLGELAPGNYTVRARLFDLDAPKASPQVLETNVPVVPPDEIGLFPVPVQPQAWGPLQMMVKSAVYFDVASMRASVNGADVRIDFDFYGDAPVGTTPPAGSSSFASVAVPSLQPGTYTVEGWGRAIATGVTSRYFTKTFTVAPTTQVVEYYAVTLGHYFMTAAPEQIASVDRGDQGDWKRTGQTFKAWLRASDAPPAAQPVCRFYGIGPNSHFYTASATDCQMLRDLEASQRADAQRQGIAFTGWQYEGIAFYAFAPANGTCTPGAVTIYRAYNNGYVRNDSNHRFTVDAAQRMAMAVSWTDEGAVMCSPP